MTQNNTIKQTSRDMLVIGKLKSINITTKKDEYCEFDRLTAKGTVVVAVETKYGMSELKLRVKHHSLTNSGEENKMYNAIIRAYNTLVSEEKSGSLETADLVKVTGSYEDGTFYSAGSGDFIEMADLKVAYVNKIARVSKTGLTNEDTSKVAFEGYISAIEPVETGELKVDMVGIGYYGEAVPITGFVPAELAIPFQNRHMVGQTTSLYFMLTKTVTISKREEEVGFGEGLGDVIEKETIKNIIVGGGKISDQGYTQEQIKQAFALREAKLENKKESALKNSQSNNMGGGNGFGAPAGAQTGFVTNQAGVNGFGAPTNNGAQTGFGAPSGFGAPAGSGTPTGFGAPAGFGAPTGFGQ